MRSGQMLNSTSWKQVQSFFFSNSGAQNSVNIPHEDRSVLYRILLSLASSKIVAYHRRRMNYVADRGGNATWLVMLRIPVWDCV